MKIEKEAIKRVSIILFFLYCWVIYIGATLVKVQVVDYDKFKKKIELQRNRTISFHPKRGTIYDAKGRILAISIETNSAFINNRSDDSLKGLKILNDAKKIINLSFKKYRGIKKRVERGDSFVWLKRKVEDRDYERLKSLRQKYENDGVNCNLEFIKKDEYRRVYPKGGLLCHVLGGVGIDEQGLAGFEFAQDSFIKGKGGKKQIQIDAKKRAFKNKYLEQPVFGKDYYLTIDSTVQYFVESELKKGLIENKAKSATAIVMESKTGDIIAMANYPNFDPGQIGSTSVNTIKNNAVSLVYEPGSTFKVILAAIALKNNITFPQERVYCNNGVFELEDRAIRDHTPYGTLTFEDVIVYSSNIGAAKIGLRFNKRDFYNEIKEFGFGLKAEIQLPGNENGILRELGTWSDVSVGFISHGYEIATTPIQLLKAVNVIASKGYLINLNVIKSPVSERNQGIKKILSTPVCNRIISIMKKVVSVGTGKKAALEGIEIAGKTGTAKKNINGRYVKKYIASFVGFFPAEDPMITMIVLFDEPEGKYYGGDVAAPVFRNITEKLIIYKNIIPTIKDGGRVTI